MQRYTRTRYSLDLSPLVYWPDRIIIGNVSAGPQAGQISTCLLFNNSTIGEDISVWTFFAVSTLATQLSIIVGQGQVGAVNGVENPWYPLSQSRAGLMTGHLGSANFGTVPYTVFVPTNGYEWSRPYPVATIPPGYSVSFESATQNVLLTVSCLWLVEPTPGKGV